MDLQVAPVVFVAKILKNCAEIPLLLAMGKPFKDSCCPSPSCIFPFLYVSCLTETRGIGVHLSGEFPARHLYRRLLVVELRRCDPTSMLRSPIRCLFLNYCAYSGHRMRLGAARPCWLLVCRGGGPLRSSLGCELQFVVCPLGASFPEF